MVRIDKFAAGGLAFGAVFVGGEAGFIDPGGENFWVADGGGQSHNLHFGGTVDDGFFPHCAAPAITDVVAFVEDYSGDIIEGCAHLADGGFVEHVPKNFGGHDDDGGLGVDNRIAGNQADIFFAEGVAKIPQFLVRQGFEGGGIKNALPLGDRPMDGIFTDHRFTGTCRGADHHRFVFIEGGDRLLLKIV